MQVGSIVSYSDGWGWGFNSRLYTNIWQEFNLNLFSLSFVCFVLLLLLLFVFVIQMCKFPHFNCVNMDLYKGS